MMLTAIMLLMLAVAPSIIEKQVFRDWFKDAKVGDSRAFSEPAGDGCNVCSLTWTKVSETEASPDGSPVCTMMGCAAPRFKIELK